jgi:hypothetical protein
MTTVKISRPETAVTDPPPVSVPKQTARPLVPPRAPSSAKYKNKVILDTLDGKIQWDKMSAEARKSFEELFADEKFLKQFGVVKGDQAFKPEEMAQIYDGISFVYQSVAALLLRWPAAVTKLLAYDEAEKKMLGEPTANLLNRFAPKLVMENKELLIFLMVFGSVTNAKFMAASAEAKKLAEPKRSAVVARPATGPVAVVVPAQQQPASIPSAEWDDLGTASGAVV